MEITTVRYADIPKYLQNGEFYCSLNDDDPDSTIEIPSSCFKVDGETIPADIKELAQLLNVVIFWILDVIPLGVLEFCYRNDKEMWFPVVSMLPGGADSTILTSLLTTFKDRGAFQFAQIVESGRWELITYVVDRIDKYHSRSVTTEAASLGNLKVLSLLHEEGFHWHEDTCAAAAEYGHLECIKYAHENGCPWSPDVYKTAALGGHLECMKYAFTNGLEWIPEACECAAQEGHLQVLKYAHENGCPWRSDVYNMAALGGHLDCMQYALQEGLEWHADVCDSAAFGGFLPCLQFARENGCPWDENTLYGAAKGGHLHCIRYAHLNGCPWSDQVTLIAAKSGHPNCLFYALDNGCPVHEVATAAACEFGHLTCLQLLYEYHAPWDEETAAAAARGPDAACLQFLVEHGCPWDGSTPASAAYFANIDQLRYSTARDYHPPADNLVTEAVLGGDMVCLRYLVEHQLHVIDGDVFLTALLRGKFDTFEYLLDQGCPFLDTPFECDDERWEEYKQHFEDEKCEFVRCVELAMERGWPESEDLVTFMYDRDLTRCEEFMERWGWLTDDTDDECDSKSLTA